MEGRKEILDCWISENEGASFRASICSDIRKRGVSDIFIACHDNLKGLGDAINAVFPKTKQQLCIVHQIRNSTKFVPYKDRKAVCADLKKIYGAVNLDDVEYAKEELREKWDKKYPSILRSWDANWAELVTFFEYPEQIRHLIYTTNAVEAYHRMVRKFPKAKAIFPTDDSIRKVVFLSVKEIAKKWTQPVGLGDAIQSICDIFRGQIRSLKPKPRALPAPGVYPLLPYRCKKTGKLQPAGSAYKAWQASGCAPAEP